MWQCKADSEKHLKYKHVGTNVEVFQFILFS